MINDLANATDALALLAFKQQIRRDPVHPLSTWNDSLPFCQWQGITCGRHHPHRVVAMNLTGLQLVGMSRLDISRNHFSGQIPEYIEKLPYLQYLNLSYNDFEGQVPQEGIFKNTSAVSVIGNRKLCGGSPALLLPTCLSQDTNLIGVESYGSVYKGSLDRIGKAIYKGFLDRIGNTVAVKVLNLQRGGASKSYIAECKALINVRHRNLLKIHTVCSSIDSQGDDFKALVLDYMANGNLDQWLHPCIGEQHQSKNLSLIQRLNIAVDVASALNYLHNSCEKPIVHCDLKPSNILLDEDMNAHVGDFGLARFLSEATSSCSENHTNSCSIKGTIGYVAPEYGMGGEVSTFGDVYSYGILLLEIFTGKKPTDEIFNGSLSLHQFAKLALPEQVMEIVDQSLLLVEFEGLHESQARTNAKGRLEMCLVSIISVGVACSMISIKDRMEIGDAMVEMQGIRDLYLGVGRNN
ncbi:hypothetical protein AAC387_Pa02g0376 [Persea americana]